MAIYCRRCGYEISQAEIVGYFSPEIYAFIMRLFCSTILYFKRYRFNSSLNAAWENKLVGILNRNTVPCSSCVNYEGWSRIINQANIQKEKQIQ